MKKVYIIIPVYNVERYLEKCLDSVFSQSYKSFNVIAVNDGSTDNSLEILNKYKAIYTNLFVVNKKNGGLSSARNAGISVIQDLANSLLLFVDSDDYLAYDYVEKLLDGYKKSGNCKIVCSSYYSFYDNGKIVEANTSKDFCILSRERALKNLIKGKIKCHTPCKLLEGTLFLNHKFDESIRFMEDQYLMPELFNSCEKIACIPYSGYYYYHRADSLCRSKMTISKIFDSLFAYLHIYKIEYDVLNVKKLKKDIVNQFCTIYLMMYPRFYLNSPSHNEMIKWNEINDFLKTNGGIIKYHPHNLKQALKKICFILSKKLYIKIYRDRVLN